MTKALTPTQQRNRELYPGMAAFVDEMREVFGDVKIVYFNVNADEPADNVGLPPVEVSGNASAELPANCKAIDSKKVDKRALEKQRLLEQMIKSGQIKLGSKNV